MKEIWFLVLLKSIKVLFNYKAKVKNKVAFLAGVDMSK